MQKLSTFLLRYLILFSIKEYLKEYLFKLPNRKYSPFDMFVDLCPLCLDLCFLL